MSDAYTEVDQAFNNANQYAQDALTALETFTTTLNNAYFPVPPIGLYQWPYLASPAISSYPEWAGLQSITYDGPTTVDSFTAVMDTVAAWPTFTEDAPTLTIGNAPTLPDRIVPEIPPPGDISGAIPDPLELTLPPEPPLQAIATISFAGVDMHEDWLTYLETIPTLALVEPTPFSYARGPAYSSALLTAVTSNISTRLQGGTGLSPAVEAAIWDRARDRETTTAQANIDEVARMGDALGFQLPAGAVAAKLREAEQNYYDKLSGLSRDIAIKQAELEQANLKHAIEHGMALESKLIDYSLQLERLTFDAAKAYADNALQIYQAGVEAYKAVLAGYNTYAMAYKTIIDGELAKVEVYKAQVQAELTKAQTNQTVVQAYKTTIDAKMALVEIYKAELDGAKLLMEIERLKVMAAAEQVKGVVAQVNADTAKLEAYKTQVQGQQAILDVDKTKAEVFRIKTQALAEESRTYIAEYTGQVQAYAAQVDAVKARIQAAAEKVKAIAASNSYVVDAFKAETMATESEARMHTQIWETRIKEFEAKQQISLSAQKASNDSIIATRAAQLDAAKAGAQVYAQLTSSAYGMIHASASISGGDQNSVSYAYGGDVSGTVSPIARL